MNSTQQKTKQLKNVAVAIVRDDDGRILLVKPNKSQALQSISSDAEAWEFPANDIIPGATYTETFVSEVLEITGYIIEAVSLVSSEKKISAGFHYEYVECKIVCRDESVKSISRTTHKWIEPHKVRGHFKRRINKDIVSFLTV